MSKIEWTKETWNVHLGCSLKSAGCANCYAMKFAHRGLRPEHRGLTEVGPKGPRWTGEVRFIPERLEHPLRWRKPRRIFVNSMSDLFHDDVPFEEVAAVFGVMAACPQHTFQVLTKRPARALEFFEWLAERAACPSYGCVHRDVCTQAAYDRLDASKKTSHVVLLDSGRDWPLQNVHLGVSVEDQAAADERIPVLLQCPAALRWVSYEPALGPVRFDKLHDDELGATWNGLDLGIGWLVVGGESGPGARPFDLAWARSTVDQCREAGVPCFVKQMGALAGTTGGASWRLMLKHPKGADMSEWPEDLRCREMPDA